MAPKIQQRRMRRFIWRHVQMLTDEEGVLPEYSKEILKRVFGRPGTSLPLPAERR